MRRSIKRSSLSVMAVFMAFCLLFCNVAPGIAQAAENENVIKSLKLRLLTGACENGSGDYVWNVSNSSAGHPFTYRISYTLDSRYEFEAGSIVFSLPKSILTDRNGDPADYYDMSIPEEGSADLTEENYFVYKEEGGIILVTNRINVPAGFSGYFELSYFTSKSTFEYADYGVSGSQPMEVTLNIDQGTNHYSETAVSKELYIDTNARITGVSKTAGSLIKEWNASWGEKPADADDYYYVIWEIRSSISATQPYRLTLNDTYSELDAEVVGCRFSSNGTFSTENTAENVRTNGTHCSYVLTRHLKSTYDEIVDKAREDNSYGRYVLRNDIEVTVTPADGIDSAAAAGGSGTFLYEERHFVAPGGSFQLYKYGYDIIGRNVLNSNYISNYSLDKFAEGSDISKLRYTVYTVGYPYPWTAVDRQDPYSYGQKEVRTVITDNSFIAKTAEGEMIDLTPESESYQIDSLKLNFSKTDKVYDPEDCVFQSTAVTYDDRDDITVSVYVNGAGPVCAATYSLKNDGFTDVDGSYVESFSGKTLSFQPGVTGFEISKYSNEYYYNLGAEISVTLFNNDVTAVLGNSAKVDLVNTAASTVYDSDGNTIFSNTRSGDCFIIDCDRQSSLIKKTVSYKNDKVNKRIDVNWSISFNEDFFDVTSNGRRAITQTSGIFYDLIPDGSSLDKDSITVYCDQVKLTKGNYSVEIIDDYKNSGVALLIVRIDTQGDKYEIKYVTRHSWDNLKDFGKTINNEVVYESGNDEIGKGISDKDISGLLNDVNEESDDKRFVEMDKTYTPSVITAGNLGLTIQVAANEDYRLSDTVYNNADYSYKLRFATDKGQKAEDLILFYSLENGTGSEGEASNWHGTFKGINVHEIETLGAQPVVYYSTVSSLSIEAHGDLTDADVWVRADQYTGATEDIKAVAVDLRKDSQGQDYVLPSDTGASVIIYMHSPESVDSSAGLPVAYGDVYLSRILSDEEEEGIFPELQHSGYTKLTWYMVADFELEKVDAEDSTVKVANIYFNLSGTSDYGTEINETVVTGSAGRVLFEKIEKGSYVLRETETTDDYFLNQHVWAVMIDNSGKVIVDGAEQTGALVIENDPRVHGDLYVHLLGHVDYSESKKNLEGVSFKLSGVSSYGNEITKYAATDDSGRFIIENIEEGTYTLTQLSAHEGYLLPLEQWTVICDDTGLVYIVDAEMDGIGYSQLYNEPYHTLNLKVLDDEDTNVAIAGAAFRISGTSDRGTAVDMTGTSDTYGTVTFTGLETGQYVFRQLTTDNNHLMDETKYPVTVHSDGIIEGLPAYSDLTDEPVYAHYKYVLNERVYNGIIEITKVWEDEPDDRPIPVVKISTDETKTSLPIAVMHRPLMPTVNRNAKSFKKAAITEKSQLPASAVRVDDDSSYYEAYMWYDSSSRIEYWWSDAETVYLPANCTGLFMNCSNITSIDFSGLNSSKVTDMDKMFYQCGALTSLDLSGFDTSNVTSMYCMFYYCTSLRTLKISNFNTAKVTDFGAMFASCRVLTSLEIGQFDTSSATRMSSMFDNCQAATTIDVSNFDTSKVTSMAYMFNYCLNLRALDLSSFDTSKVTDTYWMFRANSKMTTIYASELWDMSKVTRSDAMFVDCYALKGGNGTAHSSSYEDKSRAVIDNDAHKGYLTYKAAPEWAAAPTDAALTILKTGSSFNSTLKKLSGVTSFERSSVMPDPASGVYQIEAAGSAKKVYLWAEGTAAKWYSEADTVYLNSDSQKMFYQCSNLVTIDLTGFDSSKATSFNNMFSGCSSLVSLDISHFRTPQTKDASYAFSNCSSLTSLKLGQFCSTLIGSTGGATMAYMFYCCSALEELDLSNFDMSKISNTSYMFSGCSNLETIYVGDNWFTDTVTTHSSMFSGCNKLKGGKGTAFDPSHTDKAYAKAEIADVVGYLTYGGASFGAEADDDELEREKKLQISNSILYTGDEAENVFGQWIDNGDGTWTYRFKVYDADKLYYVWEESAPGYTWNEVRENPILLQYREGIKSVANITNTQITDPEVGYLTVTVHVDGNGATAEDLERKYTFTINIPGLPNGKYGEVTFANGSALVRIRNNRSISVEDIPAGMTYTVTQNGTDAYENLTVTSSGESGTIAAGVLSKADFTNTFVKTTGNLSVESRLSSGTCEGPVSYEVVLTGSKISGTQVFGDYVFRDGRMLVSLIPGEKVTVTDIPAGTEYKVIQTLPKNYTAVSSENEEGTIILDETSEAVFVYKAENTVVLTGDITLKTLVIGKYSEEEFAYTVVLEGLEPGKSYRMSGITADGQPVTEETSYTSTEAGTAVLGLTLKSGQSVSLTGIPAGAVYAVKQSANAYIASYRLEDSANRASFKKAEGDNKARNLDISTSNETVTPDCRVAVTFMNTPEVYEVAVSVVDRNFDLLAGAALEITDEDGHPITAWISNDENMEFVSLVPGTYTVHQTGAVTGYVKGQDVTFTLDEDGIITIGGEEADYIEIINLNNQINVKVTDPEGVLLADASLAIYDSEDVNPDGSIREDAVPEYTFVSAEEAKEIIGKLDGGKEYVLIELSAPQGYSKAEPIEFTAPEDEQPIELTMINRKSGYTVKVIDIDEWGGSVIGASLKLFDADGDVPVTAWLSENDAKEFVLFPGEYIVRQISSGDEEKYFPADAVRFSIGEDGTVTVRDASVERVEIINYFRNSPKAGDDSVMGIYLALAIFSLTGLCVLCAAKKRRAEE